MRDDVLAATRPSTRTGCTWCTTASTPRSTSPTRAPTCSSGSASTRTGRRSSSSAGSPGRRACRTCCGRRCRSTRRCSSCCCAGAPDTDEIAAEVTVLVEELRARPGRCRLDPADAAQARGHPGAHPRHGVRLPVDLRADGHRQPRGDGLRGAGGGHRDRRHPRGRRRRRDRAAGADRAGRRRHRHAAGPGALRGRPRGGARRRCWPTRPAPARWAWPGGAARSRRSPGRPSPPGPWTSTADCSELPPETSGRLRAARGLDGAPGRPSRSAQRLRPGRHLDSGDRGAVAGPGQLDDRSRCARPDARTCCAVQVGRRRQLRTHRTRPRGEDLGGGRLPAGELQSHQQRGGLAHDAGRRSRAASASGSTDRPASPDRVDGPGATRLSPGSPRRAAPVVSTASPRPMARSLNAGGPGSPAASPGTGSTSRRPVVPSARSRPRVYGRFDRHPARRGGRRRGGPRRGCRSTWSAASSGLTAPASAAVPQAASRPALESSRTSVRVGRAAPLDRVDGMSDVLHFSQVSVLRDGATLLDRLDWDVAEGERWVVLGPNGAGKTTLLQLASAHLHPTAASAVVLGETLGAVDVFELRPRIGLSQRRAGRAAARPRRRCATSCSPPRTAWSVAGARATRTWTPIAPTSCWPPSASPTSPTGATAPCPRASASGCRSPAR